MFVILTNFQENRCLATTPEVSLLKNLTVYFLLRLLQKFSIKSQLSSALIVFPLAGNRSDCYKMILCLEVKLSVKMLPNSTTKNIFCVSWCPRRSLSPPRKSSLPYAVPPKLFKPQNSPHSSSFRRSHKIVDGGRNYTKIWEGKACR